MSKITRPVSFRVPIDTYEALRSATEACGMDISSALNLLLAEALPRLVELRDERLAAIRALTQKPNPEDR